MVDGDSVLVKQALKGDETAFEEIVRRYERTIYNVAYRMVRNHDDSLDITQTVFVKAYRKLSSFNPSYKLFSWLYAIAVNESINYIKKQSRMVPTDLDLGVDQRTPADAVASAEVGEQIQTALMGLSLDYRIVVVLKYFLEMSYREIAEIVGIPEKTVKSRLYTARERLRVLLVKQGVSR